MKKHSVKIILSIILSIIAIPLLLWAANILLDIYPGSQNVNLVGPGINRFYENASGHERRCLYLYWGFKAGTQNAQSEIRDYYIQRWGGEHWPGGNEREIWEYFPIIELTKWNIGIFGVKAVYFYPIDSKIPEIYFINTEIDFCRLNNWYSLLPTRLIVSNSH